VVKFESAKETSIVNETLVNRHHLSVVKFESLNHGDEHNLGRACLRGAVEEQESGAREKVQGGGVVATGRMSTWGQRMDVEDGGAVDGKYRAAAASPRAGRRRV
jgi:hypothetical protein